jgi:hypothetical protein
MNKRELLTEFIKIAHSQHGDLYKHTETEEIENWCWFDSAYGYQQDHYSKNVQKVKLWIDTHGWKCDSSVESEQVITKFFGGYNGISQMFFNICYNKIKDKISFSKFETGYSYQMKGHRLYPYRKNIPLLCFSKHIYAFIWQRPKKYRKWYPRIYNGRYYQNWMNPYLKRVLNCTDEVLKLFVEHRYMENKAIQWRAFVSKYDVPTWKIMYKLKLEENFNYLIETGYDKTREMCQVVNFRIEEQVLDNTPQNTLYSSLNLLRE